MLDCIDMKMKLKSRKKLNPLSNFLIERYPTFPNYEKYSKKYREIFGDRKYQFRNDFRLGNVNLTCELLYLELEKALIDFNLGRISDGVWLSDIKLKSYL